MLNLLDWLVINGRWKSDILRQWWHLVIFLIIWLVSDSGVLCQLGNEGIDLGCLNIHCHRIWVFTSIIIRFLTDSILVFLGIFGCFLLVGISSSLFSTLLRSCLFLNDRLVLLLQYRLSSGLFLAYRMNHFLLLILALLLLQLIRHRGSTCTIRWNHEVLLVKLLFYAKDPLLDTLQHLNHLLLELRGTWMRTSCIQGPQKHSRWQCLLAHLLLKLHGIPFEDIAKLICILLLWSICSSRSFLGNIY